MTADEIIRNLGLEPLGFEGGFYKETYRQGEGAATAIFYLLTPTTCSLMHRLRDPELYHFYLGDPVEMLMLSEEAEIVILGQDLAAGQRVQHLVPGGVWQGSRLVPGGRFALMGTTMTPGFDLANFRLGSRDELLCRFPSQAALLTLLTPHRVKTPRLELAAATKDLLHAEQRGPEILGAGLDAKLADDWPPPLHDLRSIRFTLAQLARDANHRGWWQWYFIQRDPRVVVGTGGFKGPPNAFGEVEIGYAIVESFQKNGLATEAAAALTAHAFEDQRVERVVARARPGDGASLRVLEKNGFVSKGIDGEGLRFVKERPPRDEP